ncbi:transcriptional regulators LysR family [Vibrio sp. RC586]|uniref:LysR family transcriptional regulator n=1 Tax=Vibrio sp. RC586 TaxID=675815 RepID=UPI0001BB7DA5|nr:LysR family transcriptional regulator [Vibrio sp. RC586]EEZ00466.1 transcriptional regulators LysR family [Vibrio sp. RC586]
MNLDLLRILIAVVDNKSFIAAAKALDISQPTLSRKIKSLEDDINFKIIHRGNRELSLTPQGENFIHVARNILQQWNEGLENINQQKNHIEGNIKIGLLHPMARWISDSFVKLFLEKNPRIKIELVTKTPKQLLFIDDCDLLISPIMPEDDSLVAIKILDFYFRCYASPEYLNKYGIPETPTCLDKHNCIANINHPGNEKSWQYITPLGEEKTIPITGNITTDSIDIAKNLAKSGVGIIQLPEFQALDFIENNDLIELFPHYHFKRGSMNIILRSREHITQKIKVFINEFRHFIEHEHDLSNKLHQNIIDIK